MDCEEFEPHNYDSDFVDEETEQRLYSVVFFGAPPGSECYSPNVARDTSLFQNHTESISNYVSSNVSSQTPSISNKTGQTVSVNICSFRDESCSDYEDFDIRDGPECVNISSTSDDGDAFDLYVEATSSDSSTPSSGLHWCSDDVVLGVAGHSISTMSTPDDDSLITQRVAASSSDPNLWHVDLEDVFLQRSKPRDSRYFSDASNTVCSTCKKRGHFSSNCRKPGPACIFCGDQGHTKNECKSIYCYVCLAPGHSKRTCTLRNYLKHSTCQRCGLQGHQLQLCTELWRQYKHTIEAGRPIQPSWTMSVSSHGCCNCGRRGHTVEECNRKQFRSSFIGPSPRRCVRVYDRKDIYGKIKSHTLNKRRTKKQLFEKAARDAAKRGVVTAHGSNRRHIRELPHHLLSQSLTQVDATEEMFVSEQIEPNLTSSNVESTSSPAQHRHRASADGAVFISLDSRVSTSDTHRKDQNTSRARRKSRHRDCAAVHSPFVWINERMSMEEINTEESYTPIASVHLRGIQADHHSRTPFGEERRVLTKSHGAHPSATHPRRKTRRTVPHLPIRTKNQSQTHSHADTCLPGGQPGVCHLAGAVRRLSRLDSVMSGPKVKANNKEKRKQKKNKYKKRTFHNAQSNSSAWLYHTTKPAKIESWDASPTSAIKQE
ncbi:unnamed protein product [Dicrocoelium dendriticum]|nr:unnamed protein product [Dicrocoelium dendriticum]